MEQSFKCAQCAQPVRVTYYAILRSSNKQATPIHCERCGQSHAYLGGSVEAINPPTFPVDTPGKLAPWRIYSTRPFLHGVYHCKFFNVDGFLELYWDGTRFLFDGGPVAMKQFRGWRGVWTV